MEVIYMSIRSERIKALVDSSGMSYQDIEKLTGIKKSSLQRYASGVTTKIPLDVIEKLANTFNVSQEYLMGWDKKESSTDELQLTDGEKALIKLLRRVPAAEQPIVIEKILSALDNQE
jgi:transcriptional regulator with XRE-family HTH domain